MAERKAKPAPVPISGLAHIGIRVHDLERSVRFYALLGFTKTAGPIGPEPVAILDHPSGVELNLVLNAPSANEPNVLMDIPMKHPGITHFALLCPGHRGREGAARGGRYPAERRPRPLRARAAHPDAREASLLLAPSQSRAGGRGR
jgi:catechol 2,3-dioxygenase-like lactoylglutathione lyase family enzyme